MASAELQACVGATAESELAALPITPEWSALDLLRHVWIWSALGVRCLEDWPGERAWLPFADEDRFNVEAVATRRAAGLREVSEGLRASHLRFAEALDRDEDAEQAERGCAPWGEQVTRLHMINELLGHALEHLAEIKAAIARRGAAAKSDIGPG